MYTKENPYYQLTKELGQRDLWVAAREGDKVALIVLEVLERRCNEWEDAARACLS